MILTSNTCNLNMASLLLFFIKLGFIGYTTILYFIIGYIISHFTNKIIGEVDEEYCKNKSTIRLIIEIICHLYIVGILLYLCKTIVFNLPLPLKKFEQLPNIHEFHNIYVLNFIVLYFHNNFKLKMDYIFKRLTK